MTDPDDGPFHYWPATDWEFAWHVRANYPTPLPRYRRALRWLRRWGR